MNSSAFIGALKRDSAATMQAVPSTSSPLRDAFASVLRETVFADGVRFPVERVADALVEALRVDMVGIRSITRETGILHDDVRAVLDAVGIPHGTQMDRSFVVPEFVESVDPSLVFGEAFKRCIEKMGRRCTVLQSASGIGEARTFVARTVGVQGARTLAEYRSDVREAIRYFALHLA